MLLKEFTIKETFSQLTTTQMNNLLVELSEIYETQKIRKHNVRRENIVSFMENHDEFKTKAAQYKQLLREAVPKMEKYPSYAPVENVSDNDREYMLTCIENIWRITPHHGSCFIIVHTGKDEFGATYSHYNYNPFYFLIMFVEKETRKMFDKSFFDYEKEYNELNPYM